MKLSPLSWVPRRPSGVTLYADQNEASPPLGPAAAKLSPLSWAPGRSSGVVPHAKQNQASPSLGATNFETDVTLAGSWEVQRSDVTRTSE